jgi:hypothetical protein
VLTGGIVGFGKGVTCLNFDEYLLLCMDLNMKLRSCVLWCHMYYILLLSPPPPPHLIHHNAKIHGCGLQVCHSMNLCHNLCCPVTRELQIKVCKYLVYETLTWCSWWWLHNMHTPFTQTRLPAGNSWLWGLYIVLEGLGWRYVHNSPLPPHTHSHSWNRWCWAWLLPRTPPWLQ